VSSNRLRVAPTKVLTSGTACGIEGVPMQQPGLRGRRPEATGQRLIVMTLDHAGATNHLARRTAHPCKQRGRTLATLPEAPLIRVAPFAFLGCALVAPNLLELRIDNLILGLA
jgi:hypothetical protein